MSRTINGEDTATFDSVDLVGDGLACDGDYGSKGEFLNKNKTTNAIEWSTINLEDHFVKGEGIEISTITTPGPNLGKKEIELDLNGLVELSADIEDSDLFAVFGGSIQKKIRLDRIMNSFTSGTTTSTPHDTNDIILYWDYQSADTYIARKISFLDLFNYYLGSSASPKRNIYTDQVIATGPISPNTDNSTDLGIADKRFRYLYLVTLSVDVINSITTNATTIQAKINPVTGSGALTIQAGSGGTLSIGAHAQTGNITMSGTHNIGTDPARAGTIYATTLNATNLVAPSIQSFTIVGGGINMNGFDLTATRSIAVINLSGHSLTGAITMSGTHQIGTDGARAGTIYATTLNAPTTTTTNLTATTISGFTIGGDLTMGGNDINGAGSINVTNLNATTTTTTNLSAHAQTGNITMSGTHDIGTDPARAGTIYSTTLNTTNLHATHFTPANIGAFSLTGNITCSSTGLTIAGTGTPLHNIKSLDMTLTNKLTTAQISGFQLDGNIDTNINTGGGATGYDIGTDTNRIQNLYVETLIPRAITMGGLISMAGTHNIGTGAAPVGTIYAQNLNDVTNPNLSIHTKDLIVRNSDNSHNLIRSSGTSTKFFNSTATHDVVNIDQEKVIVNNYFHGTMLFKTYGDLVEIYTNTTGSNNGHKLAFQIFEGKITTYAHNDASNPIMTINTNLNLGSAGQINFHSLEESASGGSAVGDMYRTTDGFLKVKMT